MSLYSDRVSSGLCGMCSAVNNDGSLCGACKEKCRIRAAATRAKNRETGCLGCGAAISHGTRCESCKAQQKASRIRSTARRKEDGTCVKCSNPAKLGCVLCQRCIDASSLVSSERYWARKAAGTCRFCDNPQGTDSVLCGYHKAFYADYRARIKLEALEAYGGPVCVGCGETEFGILEVDHIDGGGCKHRKELKMEGAGHQFYLWLRRNGYPNGFRILCPTCNRRAYCGTLVIPDEIPKKSVVV